MRVPRAEAGMAPQIHRAPAKLNLFLHVVGRREDGYHLIQSAMQLVDLEDEVTIVATDDGHIVRTAGLSDLDPADDLAVRAARLLQAASGTSRGARIGIEKRIPVGGGLGGGSSDAATVLLALNAAWGLGWSRSRLAEVGLSLGADVPFFISGTNAFVEGIGERLTPLDLPRSHYALVHPGVAVPTALVFADRELTRDTAPLRISGFSSAEVIVGARESPRLVNDLQPVATRMFEPVADALAWLDGRGLADGRCGASDAGAAHAWRGALGSARMSGSGACVFRAFDSREAAAACIACLPGQWRGWAVSSLDAHPARGIEGSTRASRTGA